MHLPSVRRYLCAYQARFLRWVAVAWWSYLQAGCVSPPDAEVSASSAESASPPYDDSFDGAFRIGVFLATQPATATETSKKNGTVLTRLQTEFDALPGAVHHISQRFALSTSPTSVSSLSSPNSHDRYDGLVAETIRWVCAQAAAHRSGATYDSIHLTFAAEGDAACVANVVARRIRKGACNDTPLCSPTSLSAESTESAETPEAADDMVAPSEDGKEASLSVRALTFLDPTCPNLKPRWPQRTRDTNLDKGIPALLRYHQAINADLNVESADIQTKVLASGDDRQKMASDVDIFWRYLATQGGLPVPDSESLETRTFADAATFSREVTGTVFQRRRLSAELSYENVGALADMKGKTPQSTINAWMVRNKRGLLLDARAGIPLLEATSNNDKRAAIAEKLWSLEPLPIPLGWLSNVPADRLKKQSERDSGVPTSQDLNKFVTFRRHDLHLLRWFFASTNEVKYPNTSNLPAGQQGPPGAMTLFRLSELLHNGSGKVSESLRDNQKLLDDPCQNPLLLPGRVSLWPAATRASGELWSMMAHLLVYAFAPVPLSDIKQRFYEAYEMLNDILYHVFPQNDGPSMQDPPKALHDYFEGSFKQGISVTLTDQPSRTISPWMDPYVLRFLEGKRNEYVGRSDVNYLKMHPDRFAAELAKWSQKTQNALPVDLPEFIRTRLQLPILTCPPVPLGITNNAPAALPGLMARPSCREGVGAILSWLLLVLA